MAFIRLLGSALAKFDRDRGFFLASGIAFQVLLCLVPFTLLLLSFAGSYLFSHERVVEHLGRYLRQAAPALDPALQRTVLDLISHRGAFGLVGTVGLLWVAATVFRWLRIALNIVFDVPRGRGTLRGFGVDLLMIVLCGAAFVLSVGLTAAVEFLRRSAGRPLPALTEPLLHIGLAYLIPLAATVLVCFLIYHLVPNRKVAARSAWWGALFSALLWEAAKHLFAWYVARFGSYSIVYGSLGAAAVLLVWVYYSAAVLLLGAEMTALLDARPGTEAD